VKTGDQYTAVYVIRGLALGRTDIVATAVQHGKKSFITSAAREIQVCTKLSVNKPWNLFSGLSS